VVRALEQVADENAAIDTNQALLRRSLERRWDVEDIGSIGWKEVAIQKTSEGFSVSAIYEVERPFIANVYLLTKFEKTVVIPQ
jgi:hypothetical protein